MAITVKKKKMTVKTVRAKGQAPASDTEVPEEMAPAPAAPPQRVGRPRVDGRVYTFSVVIAIISILMFIGLITIQALELHFYYQPRPVFLRQSVPGGGVSTAPATEPEPEPEPEVEEAPANVE